MSTKDSNNYPDIIDILLASDKLKPSRIVKDNEYEYTWSHAKQAYEKRIKTKKHDN